MRKLLPSVLALGLLLPVATAQASTTQANTAQAVDPASILPPAPTWDGRSRSVVLPPDHPWATPAEVSGFRRTPSYDETVAFLKRLVAESKNLAMVSLGRTVEGRDIWMVIASDGGQTSPDALIHSGRPIVLAQAGIHAGEIDGKDAGLMLLRDLATDARKARILRSVTFLFVPIFNADGHERTSPYNRINQRGPESMGWRTTSRNRNLNRDYAKVDTPEMRAMIGALNRFQPDIYLDLHVTDGADYQYDITYGWNVGGHSPGITEWLETVFRPNIDLQLNSAGHIPGPLVFLVDEADPTQGNQQFFSPPRFSTGLGDVRHLPTVLVENHSLKPYDQRVLGTYVLLEATLTTLASKAAPLRLAVAQDSSLRPAQVPVAYGPAPGEPVKVKFKGIEAKREKSKVSGGEKTVYTAKPFEVEAPVLSFNHPTQTVTRPVAYYVPSIYTEVLERLEVHGIRTQRLANDQKVKVEMYRLVAPQLGKAVSEGRIGVTAETRVETREEVFRKGAVRVPTDQPLGDLAVLLLEPSSPDSFFQWGFFNEILQRTEYFEEYAAEPLAERMLAADPALKAEFEKKLAAEPDFAKNPRARLHWVYERSPFNDDRYLLYPIGRELPAEAKPAVLDEKKR